MTTTSALEGTQRLMLENGGQGDRIGRPAKAKQMTVYANSRFPIAREVSQD